MALNLDDALKELASLEQIYNIPCTAGIVDPVPVTQQEPTLSDEPVKIEQPDMDPPCVMAAQASGHVQMIQPQKGPKLKPRAKGATWETPEPPEPPERLPGLKGKAGSHAEKVPVSSTTLFQVPSTPLQARHASPSVPVPPSSKTAAPSVPVPPWRGGAPPLVPEQPTHPPPGHVLAPPPPLHPPPPPAPSRTLVPPPYSPLVAPPTSERVSVPMARSLPTPPPPPSAPVSVPKVSSSSNDGQAKGGGKAKGRWPGERGGKRKYWQSALGLARLDGREAEKAFMAKHPRPESREEDEAFARR